MKLKRKPEKKDWLNIAAIIILLGLFIWIGLKYTETFGAIKGGDLVSSAEGLRRFILSYGNSGIIVMIFLHALHVVISFIPSALVQFTGGLIYGMGLGMVTGLIGIPIGTAISFYLSRFMGRRVVTLFVGERDMNKLEGLVSGDVSAILLLILFMLPTPKDFFAYFVGLTNMKASKFFLISITGRIPGMLTATYLGSHVLSGNYVLIIAVASVCGALSLLAFIFKDKILTLISR